MLIRSMFAAAVVLGGVYVSGAIGAFGSGGSGRPFMAADADGSALPTGQRLSEAECRVIMRKLVDENFDELHRQDADSAGSTIAAMSETVVKLAALKSKARALGCDVSGSNNPFTTIRDDGPSEPSMSWDERMRRNDQDPRFTPGKPMARATGASANPYPYR